MSFTVEVGRLLWNPLRDYLRARKFAGMDVEWIESSGWIKRTFTIKGSEASMAIVRRDLARWAKGFENDASAKPSES